MIKSIEIFMKGIEKFFLIYLLVYITYLFISVFIGAWYLYKKNQMTQIENRLKHQYYFPISIIVPAYNEEVTIVDSIKSLLKLDYNLYEIIIVDDGSKDNTVNVLLESFNFKKVNRPIHKPLKCKQQRAIYETRVKNITLTLISKDNGGKGDSLNMGINASRFPYFICIDADSILQKDSLEKIVQPLLENESIIAVGGLIQIAQCAEIQDGLIKNYKIPNNPIISMQTVEYSRSFLASRILMNQFNGNLIISGAFGLFKKDIVISVGGYDESTLGEDMELVVKLHVFCRNNKLKYSIYYEPSAICWSQAPVSLKDLMSQRRRWYLGLFQCMIRYNSIFGNIRFGLISWISYMYYLIFELLSPIIEIIGIFSIFLAKYLGILNTEFMIKYLILYSLYGTILTITSFFQIIYTQKLKMKFLDIIKLISICFIESIFFRYILSFVRITSFLGYKKKKNVWGSIKRISNT